MKNKPMLILLVIIVLSSLFSCEQNKKQLSELRFVLATEVEIKLLDHATQEAMDEMFERLEEIEQTMSVNVESSDIYKLNHAEGEKVRVSDDTYEVLEKAQYFYTISEGYFDASLGVVTALWMPLWDFQTGEATIPKEETIKEALFYVDGSKIELFEDNEVSIIPGMDLDLGGIAKGYAADELVKIAEKHGIESAIFSLGGNVLVHGSKKGENFVLGIRNPENNSRSAMASLEAQDKTLVTSGDYEHFYEDESGKRYHHILDYRTGYPADNELASVSILAEESIDADALSTAIYAMGLEEGLAFAEKLEHIEAAFITRDKLVYLTSGLKGNFKLLDDTFKIKE